MHNGHSLWSRLEPQIRHYYAVWWRLTNIYMWKQFKWFIWSQSADCTDLRIVHLHWRKWRKCYSTTYSGIRLRNINGKILYNSCISVKKIPFLSFIFYDPNESPGITLIHKKILQSGLQEKYDLVDRILWIFQCIISALSIHDNAEIMHWNILVYSFTTSY